MTLTIEILFIICRLKLQHCLCIKKIKVTKKNICIAITNRQKYLSIIDIKLSIKFKDSQEVFIEGSDEEFYDLKEIEIE